MRNKKRMSVIAFGKAIHNQQAQIFNVKTWEVISVANIWRKAWILQWEDEELGEEMTKPRCIQIAFDVSLAKWEIRFETKHFFRDFLGNSR